MGKSILKKREFTFGPRRIYGGNDLDDLLTDVAVPTDIDLQDYIDEYYPFFQNTLGMYREITTEVYLNINDINRLDFAKPYWIEKWGWFLLENVTFRKGRKAKVKMIHINKSDYVPDLVGNDYDDRDYNSNDYYL